ncbi:MAG: sugar ABC transporter permease [Clostridia bacterium]|nr:sugar ABC transporter permease [Clostridia bacterium]
MQRAERKPGAGAVKPYLYLLPMLVFAVGFVYYPFLKTVAQSVAVVNFKGEMTGFAGLDNFRYLFSRREFTIAIANTLRLMGINVPVTLALTILLAWFSARPRRWGPVYETMLALPMTVSMSAITLIFKVLLNPTVGFVNYALGIHAGWYTDRHTAMSGILMLTVWMGIGFNYLLFLSAFRAVPEDLIGSARLDGAGPLTVLFRVQLPLISPTILYVACTNMIQAMMTSGPVLILTQGGPSRSTTTLIYLMYTSGYRSSNYGLAACVSLIAFAMTLVFAVLLIWLEGRKVNYQ